MSFSSITTFDRILSKVRLPLTFAGEDARGSIAFKFIALAVRCRFRFRVIGACRVPGYNSALS
jgi:hypothetical protein